MAEADPTRKAEDGDDGNSEALDSKSRSHINDKENGLKAFLALLLAKKGLEDFVETEIIAMHGDILKDLRQNIRTGSVCGQCTTANLTSCSDSGVCGRKCRIHDQTDDTKRYRPCPNNVCNEVMDQITVRHRYSPTWQNTDATKWFNNPWELAKCFLPQAIGSSSSASEADFSVLLNIIINNRHFEQKLSENMRNDNNRFSQARDVRNSVCHTHSGEMSTDELHDIIDLMISLLSDGKCLVLNQAAQEAVEKLKELKDEPLVISREEAQKIRQEVKLQYEADKRSFQHHLANQYVTLHSKVPISHLVSELNADLDAVYAPQSLRQVKLPHETDHEGSKQSLPAVQSYKDVFLRGSQRCKNIYVKGDAGTGKTFFTQKIVKAWSKYINGQSITEEEEFIKEFAFLFYIPLKHVQLENDLDEMIFNHPLLQYKGYKNLIKRLLQEESDQCLILLDGLDEWSPTRNTSHPYISKGLPLRDVTRHCTILTTTRPWKVEAVRMKSTEIDQLIELTGLNNWTSWQYIESLVKCLNERFGLSKSANDFMSMLQANKLSALSTIPVIVRNLVCVWQADKPIGNSLIEIYSGMLDSLLDESINETKVLESTKEPSPSDKLPPCFKNYRNCRYFGQILISLSKLSFYTLYDKKRELSLVFDKTVAEIHGMSLDEIQACLSAGILSQDIAMRQPAVPEKKLSFLHKTFQEFLAAVYICLFHETTDDIISKVRDICCSVEMVLEMQKVFVFLSGMCPSVMSRLSGHIAGIVTADERVTTYRNTVDCMSTYIDYPNVLKSVQSLMSECMIEARCNGVSEHLNIYIQDVIISGYMKVPESVDQLVQCSNGHIKSVYIAGNQHLGVLQHATQTDGIVKVATVCNWHGKIALSRLLCNIGQYCASLRCLDLSGVNCGGASVETLSELFGCLSHLEAIKLHNAILSHEQWVWVLGYLSRRTELRQVCLSSKDGTAHKTRHIILDLKSHSQLTDLILNRQYVGHIRRRTLKTLELLELPTHCLQLDRPADHIQLLTHCPRLDRPKLSDLHADHIQLLTHCPRLDRPKLSDLHADHIQLPTHCTQLKTLELSKLHVDHLQLPTHCPQLETLELSDVHANHIQLPTHCPQLETLELSKLHVDHLQLPTHCPDLNTLELLELHVDHIKLLTHYPQLHRFKLSDFHADHIQLPTDCTHLKTLQLSKLHVDHLQLPTHCPDLNTLELLELHVDHIKLPTHCPQLVRPKLSDLHAGHIQLPTHCPQLETLELSDVHANHIQLPTHCPQLKTLQLSKLHADHLQLPTQCPQLETLELSDVHANHIQLPTHCPQLKTLQLSKLHADHLQLPTQCPQLETLELSDVHANHIQLPTQCPQLGKLRLLDSHVDHIQLPTNCPQLKTLKFSFLRADRIQLPTHFPQLVKLELTDLRTTHIQLPTHCPQLGVLLLVYLHVDHIQLPTDCPQLETLKLFGLPVDHIQLPTDCTQLKTLELSKLPVDHIQLPTHCPQLETLELSKLHVDHIQLPTYHQLNRLKLSDLHADHIQLPTLCPQLKTLESSKLHVDHIKLPTHCPELDRLKLSDFHADHIQLPTHCPQLDRLKLSDFHADHLQLPTHCPRLKTLELSRLHVDHIKLSTHCPQLVTLELSGLHADPIQLLIHCPQLQTLALSNLHVDNFQLPPDITHVQSCTLCNNSSGVTVSVLETLRHSSQLQSLSVRASDDEAQEVVATVFSVLPTLRNVRHINLYDLPIVNRELKFSPMMTHLERVILHDVTMCRESVHSLVNSLLQIQHSVGVWLWSITITPADDADSVLNIVRSSKRCIVTFKHTYIRGKYNLWFHTSV